MVLNCDIARIILLKDLINYAWGELIFLRTFLMDSLEQCKQQTKITDLLTLIKSVTSQPVSDIKSLCYRGKLKDLDTKISPLHFQLLLKIKFIKAV